MTEGCQYEYATGRKMLASYKNSILISALIMFIGMGALIFARHPALHSLAVVTVIGMFSVVCKVIAFQSRVNNFYTTFYSSPEQNKLPLQRNIALKKL